MRLAKVYREVNYSTTKHLKLGKHFRWATKTLSATVPTMFPTLDATTAQTGPWYDQTKLLVGGIQKLFGPPPYKETLSSQNIIAALLPAYFNMAKNIPAGESPLASVTFSEKFALYVAASTDDQPGVLATQYVANWDATYGSTITIGGNAVAAAMGSIQVNPPANGWQQVSNAKQIQKGYLINEATNRINFSSP